MNEAQNNLHFAPMTLPELEIVLQWAADEGWNPGIADAAAFYPAGGFYVAKPKRPDQPKEEEHDDDDIPIVAAISVVRHDPNMAFLGLYICHPNWRGQGIGLAIWEYGLSQLNIHAAGSGTPCIGLDAVPAQVANYERYGFRTYGATLRYQGQFIIDNTSSRRSRFLVRTMISADLETIHELDTAANGYARPRFLTSWINGDGILRDTMVLIDEQDGRIIMRGFATWRVCRQETSIKIGPIIAPSTDGAIRLIADIVATCSNNNNNNNKQNCVFIIVDVPEQNTSLRLKLEEQGLVVSFATTRMYRGIPPPTPTKNSTLQAIATMELG